MKEKIWKLEDLPELKAGDCLAFRAEGLLQNSVHIVGAKSFHWAMVGEPAIDDDISVGDYSVHDSTNKGITAHLLSEYQYRHMRVYRPKMEAGLQDALKGRIMKRYLYYGDQKYDYKGVFMVTWYLLLNKLGSILKKVHLGFSVEWWVHNSHKFWCLEFNEIVLRDLWKPIVPITEPPHPGNMERSENLELIWGTY